MGHLWASLRDCIARRLNFTEQSFECPFTIFGQVSKLPKDIPQHLFTSCPILHIPRRMPQMTSKNAFMQMRSVRAEVESSSGGAN
jgi:hypothetical protein